jgi:hypothetical protein
VKHSVKHSNTHKDKTLVEIDSYTRGRAIKVFCTECEGWEGNVRDCTAETCPLFPYRGRTTLTIKRES